MDPGQSAETFYSIQPFLFWVVAGVTGLCAIATVVTQNIVRAATWLLFTLAGTSAVFFLLGADLVGATQLLVYVGGTLILVVFGVMLTAQGPFISMRTSGAEWAIAVVSGLLLLAVLTTGVISERSLGPDNPAKRPHESVIKYAPEYSRAERQQKAARRNVSPPTFSPALLGGPPLLPDGKKGPGGPPPPGGKKGAAGPPKKGPSSPPLPTPVPAVAVATPATPASEAGMALDPATSAQSATLGEGFLGAGVGPAHSDGRAREIIRTSYLLPFEIVSIHLLVVLIGAAYLARAKRRRGGVS